MTGMNPDPAIGLLTIACIALLFASAAVHKLRDLKGFDEIFAAYGVLPTALARLSRAVPILEFAVAVGLLIPASRRYAAAAGIALLLVYAAAIAVNLRRGRRDLACGCGGPNERRPIAAWMVWRNIAIAAAATIALATWTARPLNITDAVTVVFGLLSIALAYLCADQLLAHAQRGQRLRSLR